MKNWMLFIIITVIALLFSSCYSVPKVTSQREIGKGVFIVRIGYSPSIYTKYALNTFVQSKGYESYTAEINGEPSLLGRFLLRSTYTEYIVTMPGKTPVEDMPKVKYREPINLNLK
jgi:hypothetical protein